MRKMLRDEGGQMRIVEAVFACAVLFATLSMLPVMLPRMEPEDISGGEMVSRAYNVLQCLADSGVLERAALGAEPRWRSDLRVALDQMGLSSYAYSLTIYEALSSNPFSSSLVELHEVSNLPPGESLTDTARTVSVTCPYTTSQGNVLVAVLKIGRPK